MALINKESLKANIIKMLGISGEEYLLPAERAIWNVINEEPTQEIICCKDCAFYEKEIGSNDGFALGMCKFIEQHYVTNEGFCFWAKKRGGAE